MSDKPKRAFPLYPDFNDREIGFCDRCKSKETLIPASAKNLCPECWKKLFREGGLIAFME